MNEDFYNNVDEILESDRKSRIKPYPEWDNPNRYPWIFKTQGQR